jgi:putative transposase
MARKRYKPEEIVAKLRQVDVLVSQGQNMGERCFGTLWA